MATRSFIHLHRQIVPVLNNTIHVYGYRYLCSIRKVSSFKNGLTHNYKGSCTINLLMNTKNQFSNSSFNNEFGDIGEIDPMNLDKERKGKGSNLKYLIIDVREPKELENNYNLGENRNDWINIPKDIILNIADREEFEQLLNKNGVTDFAEYQDLYFMCRGGVRSKIVAEHVIELDLDQTLFNVTGGISRYDRDVGLE